MLNAIDFKSARVFRLGHQRRAQGLRDAHQCLQVGLPLIVAVVVEPALSEASTPRRLRMVLDAPPRFE